MTYEYLNNAFCFYKNLLLLQMLMSVLCPYNSAILMLTVPTLRMVLFALARVAILEMEQIVLVRLIFLSESETLCIEIVPSCPLALSNEMVKYF